MVPMGKIELPTSPLPRECSTPELHGPELGAGEGNRTLVISLEGFCSTIELHPPAARDPSRRQIEFWWRGKDSNLRRLSRQIYSLLPLAARESLHALLVLNGADYRNRTGDLLITSQLLYLLS